MHEQQSPKRPFHWWHVSGVILIALLLLAGMGIAVQHSQSASASTVTVTQHTQASANLSITSMATKCQAVNNNPWCYNFTHGSLIYHPHSAFCSYFKCVSDFWKATRGDVVECRNGKYSHSGGIRGACSRDKGVWRTLYSH